jgi:uncharacterized membrane protein (DUF485 family)
LSFKTEQTRQTAIEVSATVAIGLVFAIIIYIAASFVLDNVYLIAAAGGLMILVVGIFLLLKKKSF